jgi:predicted amidophosphoribosyltransferase
VQPVQQAAPQPPPQAQPQGRVETLFCDQCGARCRPGKRFCSQCGAQLP